eukprot:gene39812-49200_t
MGFGGLSSTSGRGAMQDDPVRVLASRIKYYPIVQIVSRAGAAWYEFAYGFDTDSYSSDMSTTQTIALYFYGMCVPTAGIGYFLVFLIVQPAAYLHLKKATSKLYLRLICACGNGDEFRSQSRGDSFSDQVTIRGSFKFSLPLLDNGCVDYSGLDEDELSVQIDQNHAVNSKKSTDASIASNAVFSEVFRGVQISDDVKGRL